MILRPYQLRAVENLREKIRAGKRRLVLVAPTGAGKTVVASHMVTCAIDKGNDVLFLAHRKELIDQASNKLRAFGIPHGIIMAGYPKRSELPVQVASVQTLVRRDPPPAALVIVDECHHATATSYRKILEAYPHSCVIGLTATPFRSDGAGLGDSFEDFCRVSTIGELTDIGFLVPARYWSHPSAADMRGVKITRGDFDPEESAARMDRSKILGDLVENYRAVGNGARAIAFAVNVAHSEHIRDAFNAAGIPAAHLDGETPKDERERILDDLAAGTVRVVSNCGILSEGFDCPAVEVAILARPTASLGLHLQQIGRVLRTNPGKAEARILDHAGNVLRHGFASDVCHVDLSSGITDRKKSEGPSLKTCPRCYAILPAGTMDCPSCWESLRAVMPKVHEPSGKLQEIKESCRWCGSENIEKRPHELHGTGVWCLACGRHIRWMGKNTTPQEYYRKQLELCREKGWKTGRAAILFKNRYGRWPGRQDMEQTAA